MPEASNRFVDTPSRRNARAVAAITLLCVLAACSARGGYEGIQESRRLECEQLPRSQYQDCLDRANVSWEDYAREREALRAAEGEAREDDP